jgi:hypothetical protein
MTFYQTENGYPFNRIISDTKSGIKQCEALLDLLPHGSGINSDWHIKKTGKRFSCTNTYEAMDENGMYCHNYKFTVYYKINGKTFDFININFHSQRELSCCGYGIIDYLADTCCGF